MKTNARRFLATLASALIVCSSFAIPTVAHASHGIKCGFVQIAPGVFLQVCSRGV